MRPSLYNLDYQELKNQIQDWNEPSYRAPQIWQGLYQNYWNNSDDFSTIPVSLRKEIDKIYTLSSLYSERELHSTDGFTRKTLYRLEDNSAIETVLMGYEDRNTVCISSQVGCGVGCNFCATGNMGFIRNLSRAEIIEQVVNTAADLAQDSKNLTNVVFMGMGEPFHNYTQVMEAVRILNDPEGFGMGARRFTISTVGLVPGIKRFTEKNSQINLAISLHAADDELRSSIVPINQKYPISELMEACRKYIQITNRRITFEWALIEGVNDTGEQAQKLSRLIDGMLAHVNLIQLNPVSCYSGKPATKKNALNFQKTLTDSGIACTIRVRRGIDIQAGCGQLASESN
ncbi:MAG: 23S rRNA (adenine(2503)-C(2))-methyltransferase RlmN [Anaerolineales bacterium]